MEYQPIVVRGMRYKEIRDIAFNIRVDVSDCYSNGSAGGGCDNGKHTCYRVSEALLCERHGNSDLRESGGGNYKYQGENMTADVYISASVYVLEYWYDPVLLHST